MIRNAPGGKAKYYPMLLSDLSAFLYCHDFSDDYLMRYQNVVYITFWHHLLTKMPK